MKMKNYVFSGYGKKIALDKLRKPFNATKSISVIIPTYNEEGNIVKIVSAVRMNLKKTSFKDSYEIIVVDDNSKDKTPQLIDKLSKEGNFIAMHRYGSRGLFSAVQEGIYVANGKYVLTLDADFSHPPDLIPEMVKHIAKYDAVIASRYIKGGGIKIPSVIRKYGSIILNKICILLAGLDVSDFGGQFRMFNKEKYQKIKFKNESTFAEYGIELFYRAKMAGWKIKEIPFVYEFREEGDSKMGNLSKLPALGIRYISTAIKLRLE